MCVCVYDVEFQIMMRQSECVPKGGQFLEGKDRERGERPLRIFGVHHPFRIQRTRGIGGRRRRGADSRKTKARVRYQPTPPLLLLLTYLLHCQVLLFQALIVPFTLALASQIAKLYGSAMYKTWKMEDDEDDHEDDDDFEDDDTILLLLLHQFHNSHNNTSAQSL